MASVLDEPGVSLARLSVEQYHRMIEAGVLGEGDRLELLDGFLVDAMTEGPLHSHLVAMIVRLLAGMVGASEWMVRAGNPLTIGASEPEPDIALVRFRDYRAAHPGPGDVAAVVEVAQTSLVRDRTTKARIYAAAGIPVYVLVNLADGWLEVHRSPVGDGDARYEQVTVVTEGTVDLGPVTVAAADLLP